MLCYKSLILVTVFFYYYRLLYHERATSKRHGCLFVFKVSGQLLVGKCNAFRQNTSQKTEQRNAFSVAAPKLWNELPLDLRSLDTINLFKKHLKTDLFKKAYNV